MSPCIANFLDLSSHAHRIDFPRGGESADHDGDVVTPTVGIDDVGEQEGPPLILGNATKKLAAHERMQLGILVDGLVNAKK